MEKKNKSSSKRRIVIFSLIVILIVVPAIYVGGRFIRANRIIDEHRSDIWQSLDNRASMEKGRPRLWGDSLTGDAWDIYRKYFPLFEDSMRDVRELVPDINDYRTSGLLSSSFHVNALDRGMREHAAELRSVLSNHEPCVRKLCEIPRVSCAIPGFDYDSRAYYAPFPLSDTDSVTLYLTVNAWVLHHDGFDRRAAELLEIIFIVSNDISRHGVYSGHFRGEPDRAIAIERWREILANHTLTVENLASMRTILTRSINSAPFSRMPMLPKISCSG